MIGIAIVSNTTDICIVCLKNDLFGKVIGIAHNWFKTGRISVVYLWDLKPAKKKRWLQGGYPYEFPYSSYDHKIF